MSSAENAALLSHIVSQVESNVEFLVSQNYLSRADANTFLAKLPNQTTSASPPSFATRVRGMIGASPSAPAVPSRPATTAKALWAYNLDGSDPADLSFSEGDIIEIVEETNADWWMGRVHGKQALFPSAYVEKIKNPPATATTTTTPAPALASVTKTPYRAFGAAHHGHDAPPQNGTGTNSIGLQQSSGTEEKKGKFGKYGDTMAHSAAGGVGFGAGAAIGGGLVRAIF